MHERIQALVDSTIQADGVKRPDHTSRNAGVAAMGSVFAALLALKCPLALILLSLGVATGWIGNVSALTPYQPILFAIGAAQLAYGYYLIYRRPAKSSPADTGRARRSPSRLAKYSLWFATALTIAALAFDNLAPTLFGLS